MIVFGMKTLFKKHKIQRTGYRIFDRKGQSLIEILIALAIGAILIGAASLGIAFMLRSTSTNQNLQSASGLVREIIEKLRAWSSADWQNIYTLNKGLSTKYFLTASGTVLTPVQGEEGVVENEVRTNLVGRWGFDESTSTLAYDMSGNLNTGTLMGSPTRATGTACAVGGCLNLDGSTGFVDLADPGDLLNASTLTFVAWVNIQNPVGLYHGLFQLLNAGADQGYQIAIAGPSYPSALPGELMSYTGGLINSGLTVSSSTWNFVAIVFDGTNYTFYVNNQKSSFSGKGITTVDSVATRNIGKHSSSMFTGSVDDVRIYNRALSEAEITRLYKSKRFTRYFSVQNTCRDQSDLSKVSSTPCSGGWFEDPSTQKITAVVNWPTTQTIAELKLTEYLTRWRNEVFRQQDWSGGSGQEGPISVPNTRYASSTGVDISSSGLIKIQGL